MVTVALEQRREFDLREQTNSVCRELERQTRERRLSWGSQLARAHVIAMTALDVEFSSAPPLLQADTDKSATPQRLDWQQLEDQLRAEAAFLDQQKALCEQSKQQAERVLAIKLQTAEQIKDALVRQVEARSQTDTHLVAEHLTAKHNGIDQCHASMSEAIVLERQRQEQRTAALCKASHQALQQAISNEGEAPGAIDVAWAYFRQHKKGVVAAFSKKDSNESETFGNGFISFAKQQLGTKVIWDFDSITALAEGYVNQNKKLHGQTNLQNVKKLALFLVLSEIERLLKEKLSPESTSLTYDDVTQLVTLLEKLQVYAQGIKRNWLRGESRFQQQITPAMQVLLDKARQYQQDYWQLHNAKEVSGSQQATIDELKPKEKEWQTESAEKRKTGLNNHKNAQLTSITRQHRQAVETATAEKNHKIDAAQVKYDQCQRATQQRVRQIFAEIAANQPRFSEYVAGAYQRLIQELPRGAEHLAQSIGLVKDHGTSEQHDQVMARLWTLAVMQQFYPNAEQEHLRLLFNCAKLEWPNSISALQCWSARAAHWLMQNGLHLLPLTDDGRLDPSELKTVLEGMLGEADVKEKELARHLLTEYGYTSDSTHQYANYVQIVNAWVAEDHYGEALLAWQRFRKAVQCDGESSLLSAAKAVLGKIVSQMSHIERVSFDLQRTAIEVLVDQLGSELGDELRDEVQAARRAIDARANYFELKAKGVDVDDMSIVNTMYSNILKSFSSHSKEFFTRRREAQITLFHAGMKQVITHAEKLGKLEQACGMLETTYLREALVKTRNAFFDFQRVEQLALLLRRVRADWTAAGVSIEELAKQSHQRAPQMTKGAQSAMFPREKVADSRFVSMCLVRFASQTLQERVFNLLLGSLLCEVTRSGRDTVELKTFIDGLLSQNKREISAGQLKLAGDFLNTKVLKPIQALHGFLERNHTLSNPQQKHLYVLQLIREGSFHEAALELKSLIAYAEQYAEVEQEIFNFPESNETDDRDAQVSDFEKQLEIKSRLKDLNEARTIYNKLATEAFCRDLVDCQKQGRQHVQLTLPVKSLFAVKFTEANKTMLGEISDDAALRRIGEKMAEVKCSTELVKLVNSYNQHRRLMRFNDHFEQGAENAMSVEAWADTLKDQGMQQLWPTLPTSRQLVLGVFKRVHGIAIHYHELGRLFKAGTQRLDLAKLGLNVSDVDSSTVHGDGLQHYTVCNKILMQTLPDVGRSHLHKYRMMVRLMAKLEKHMDQQDLTGRALLESIHDIAQQLEAMVSAPNTEGATYQDRVGEISAVMQPLIDLTRPMLTLMREAAQSGTAATGTAGNDDDKTPQQCAM